MIVLKSYKEIIDQALNQFQLPDSTDSAIVRMVEEMAIILSNITYQEYKNMFQIQAQAQTYIYPDGTQSANPPSDGQIFIEWDQNQNPKRTWMWDDSASQWFDVTSPSSPAPNAMTDFDLVQEFDRLVAEGGVHLNDRCECGSDKVGSPKHSSWCPRHTG